MQRLQFMANVKNSKLAKVLYKIFASPLFIVGLAVLLIIFKALHCVSIGYVVIALLMVLVLVTQRDIKPIAPLTIFANCVCYLRMDLDMKPYHTGILIGCGVVVALALVYYFFSTFAVEKKKFIFGKLFSGLIVVVVVCLLSGLLCKDYNHMYTLRLFGVLALIVLGYILLVNGTDESFKDYVAYTMVIFGLFAICDIIRYYCEIGDVVSAFHNKTLNTGWAMTNSIATTLAITMPFAVYLATKKLPQIFIPITLVIYVGILFTFSRGNILFATILLPIMLVYGFLVSKNKKAFGITCGICVVGLGLLAICLKDQLADWFSTATSMGFSDNGRFELWKYAWEDFKSNKIFGAGFYGEDGVDLPGPLKKFHSTIMQIVASAGIVGLIGFTIHYVQRYKLMFTKLSVFKAFSLFSLALYEAYGLIDINMLRFFQSALLVLIFVASEKESEQTRIPAFSFNFKRRKKMTEDEKDNQSQDGGSDTQLKVQKNSGSEVLEDASPRSISESSSDNSSSSTAKIVEQIEEINKGVATTEEGGENGYKSDKELTKKHKFYRHFFKRFLDIILSGLALIILSPVYLIVSILVRVKLGKPVIFRQLRPGYKNKIFMFYKYRSMTDARDEFGELLSDEQRMTKFGKLLRKTSLDELPQLWNIFKGDMSFVGPRPKLVKDMVFYNKTQNQRSLVRPGLTGYAQANGRNLNSWKETFEYDLYYVENCSLWLDIKILFKTAIKVIKRDEILTQDQVPDAYYYGDQLLNTHAITEEEYQTKLNEAKEIEQKIMSK